MARWLAAAVCVIACHHGDAPPPPPSCIAAADHVVTLLPAKDPQAPKIREIFVTRCTTDAWSSEARSCIVGTTTLRDPHHCKLQLSSAQRTGLEHDLEVQQHGSSDDARRRGLPPACQKFGKVLDTVASCNRLPQATRDAFKQVFETMISATTQVPDDQKAYYEQSCAAALDSLLTSATTVGCRT